MMKRIQILLLLLIPVCIWAQSPMKSFISAPHQDAKAFQPAAGIPSLSCDARQSTGLPLKSIPLFDSQCEYLTSIEVTASGSYWMRFSANQLWISKASINPIMTSVLQSGTRRQEFPAEWHYQSSTLDEQNREHIRVQQYYKGYPVMRQDMVLHVEKGSLRELNGFAWTGPFPAKVEEPLSPGSAIAAAKDYLSAKNVKFQDHSHLEGLFREDNAQLCWLPKNGKLILVYAIEMHPNVMDHWKLYVNAVTLEVIEAYSQLCKIYPFEVSDKPSRASHAQAWLSPTQTPPKPARLSSADAEPCRYRVDERAAAPARFQAAIPARSRVEIPARSILLDGPTTTFDSDLLGLSRLVNGYLVGSNYYMIDASRTSMFQPMQSVLPNEPLGVIWTIDGQNGSPQQQNFEVIHVSNTNNNWDPLEVSAHYNGGQAFEYFLQEFNWNSLNGEGGNIISIINVADDNGEGLDNAFWSGTAMFYGNGNVAFKPLARGLDVAGHEMSHGVVQNTANLEYVGQSGALNESYADVFGAMIDREDWQMGEDVVNLSFFPSGALRDLSNPHNGGNGPEDDGWQPQHMSEYQNLPNTPEGDNGGVHVNSGIPNRAFFLLASNIGKDKAEQIYFKALHDYLVMSSQFIDMRNAVERAATDLHGANSAEVMAVRSAFDGVGIGAGQGNDHQNDIETNPGADFILATDEQESDLYWVPPSNPSQFVKLNLPAPLSLPSFTDDGTSAVYVDQENEMILLIFDWSQGLSYEAFYLEDNPQGIWRNVVVSKDGTKIAYTTSELLNEIGVFDFPSQSSWQYFLYNPTSAEGISTGDVLFADVMEWDYSGQYLMYDALNRIESTFGDGIEYWDISFINVWDNDVNDFGDGFISKLFTALPENVSVGNPSFAKNSPYVITFDYVEDYYDDFGFLQTAYLVLAANIETGDVNVIYENTTVGYPSYSRMDDQILFTYDDFGSLLLATIDVQPSNKTLPVPGSDEVLITGAQKGVWFQTGERVISGSDDVTESDVLIFPQPAKDDVYVLEGANAMNLSIFRLIDMTGKEVRAGNIDGNRIDLHSVPSGTYVLELQDQHAVYRKMLLKG